MTYWNQFSENKLEELEERILSTLKTPYKTLHVPVQFENDSNNKVWTIILNGESPNVPLVLVHGFAAGIGFWCRNLDELAKNRPVYAMDLLGFGRSSRPDFGTESSEVERKMIDGIEAWRTAMRLEKFYLLGHSMGGFLSTSYAISYPERVSHLILADPWGFSDHFHENPSYFSSSIFWMLHIRPLEIVRAMGPLGPWLIRKVRYDIADKFEGVLEDTTIMPNYVYQCNAQNPTGERAFCTMLWGYGWARNPMIHRITELNEVIPITFIYGSETFMDKSIGTKIQEMRSNSYVKVQIIDGTGHHLYSEKCDIFNEIVSKACEYSDDLTEKSWSNAEK